MHDPYDFTDIVKRPKRNWPLRVSLAIIGVAVLTGGAFGYSNLSKKPQTNNLVSATAAPTITPSFGSSVLGANSTPRPIYTPQPIPTYSPNYSAYKYSPPEDTSTSYAAPTLPSYTPPPRVNYCSRAQITSQYNSSAGSINRNYDSQIGNVTYQAQLSGTLDSGMVQSQIDSLNRQRQQELAAAQSREQNDLANCSQP